MADDFSFVKFLADNKLITFSCNNPNNEDNTKKNDALLQDF